jgi:hypothetical protein
MVKMNTNEAWQQLFDDYGILNKIDAEGKFEIDAKQIRKYREPRLMAKFDCYQNLPNVFKKNKINILPTSRGSYVLGRFKLFQDLGDFPVDTLKINKAYVPNLETVDITNISSEAMAINVMSLSSILSDFLGVKPNYQTISGRMGSGEFNFSVDTYSNSPINIAVKNAQIEIDGGFENSENVILLEAKNVFHQDFNVRQLYFPYRTWSNKVNKPIRLIFMVYFNQVYRLLEYEFVEVDNYSSLSFVQEKLYSLENTYISLDDLRGVYKNTKVNYTDNMKIKGLPPFPQADDFSRIINLLEVLNKKDLSVDEITEIMGFTARQTDYYYNAGLYLGLFKKYNWVNRDENKVINVKLTDLGREINKMNYKDRQLKLVSLLLEHKIFNGLFFKSLITGKLPSRDEVIEEMIKFNVCSAGSVATRRSQTVLSWLNWVFSLTQTDNC